MLTVTSIAFHEKLHVGTEEIILNGPPSDLRGHMLLSNNNEESLRVRALPLIHDEKIGNTMSDGFQLRLSCRLKPGEEKMESVWHKVHPNTLPGIYESSIMAGGQKRKVKMVIQSHIDINIYPDFFSFQDTSPGKIHTAIFTLTNLGNMPFQVPEIKHVAPLDMDLLCRAFGFGFRSKGAEGFTVTMDEITKNIRANLTDWSPANVDEIGKIVAPGESLIIHLNITLPANSDSRKDYDGNIRFWDKDIAFAIKSHNENLKK